MLYLLGAIFLRCFDISRSKQAGWGERGDVVEPVVFISYLLRLWATRQPEKFIPSRKEGRVCREEKKIQGGVSLGMSLKRGGL